MDKRKICRMSPTKKQVIVTLDHCDELIWALALSDFRVERKVIPQQLENNSLFFMKLILFSNFVVPNYYYEKISADHGEELIMKNTKCIRFLNPKILSVDFYKSMYQLNPDVVKYIQSTVLSKIDPNTIHSSPFIFRKAKRIKFRSQAFWAI